ncbi:MAG: hypothetical protein WDM91_14400 [Rhizomicrobium sp.]
MAAYENRRPYRTDARVRPSWLPHPAVVAFIMALWATAGILQFGHVLPH